MFTFKMYSRIFANQADNQLCSTLNFSVMNCVELSVLSDLQMPACRDGVEAVRGKLQYTDRSGERQTWNERAVCKNGQNMSCFFMKLLSLQGLEQNAANLVHFWRSLDFEKQFLSHSAFWAENPMNFLINGICSHIGH